MSKTHDISKMEIIEKKSFTVVGIKVEADWQELHTKMPEMWETAKKRLTKIEKRKEDIMMDLSLEVNDGRYTQLIGIEVEKSAAVPDGMEKVSIPDQSYIHHQHKGELPAIAESFGKIYDWAEEHDIGAGDFKIDYGYLRDGSEEYHDLYVRIETD